MSNQNIAGIDVPDSALVKAAIALCREHLADFAYNHIMRSMLFGFAIADKIPGLRNRDREVHAVAAIMHDLSWDEKGIFASADKRFEVDSAVEARKFIQQQTSQLGDNATTWDAHRLQLVWDAIALHTTPSIGMYKEAEVQATGLGILADFVGVKGVPGGALSQQEWDAIVAGFPRSGFRQGVTDVMCGLCRTKPETTYDNFVGDFGEEMVQGFTRQGHRAFDMMVATQE